MLLLCMVLLAGSTGHASLAQLDDDSSLADSVTGTWRGKLVVPGGGLTLVLHISQSPDGALRAGIDSPDQGATGIPVSKIDVSGKRVRLELPNLNAYYEGTLAADGKTIDGAWRQGGQSFPLTFRKEVDSGQAFRPQEPRPPYPYHVEEVAFQNPGDGITLAGTLTIPRSNLPVPAVVLLSGSGPQDRDEQLFGHKPFLVLADHLTRSGIAVLRYDDRGVAASEGSFEEATIESFISDARAAVSYLHTRTAIIDTGFVGLIGHSEGGLVAPAVAARDGRVDFLVLLAAPALPGDQILLRQSELLAEGAPTGQIQRNQVLQRRIFSIVKDEHNPDSLQAKVRVEMKRSIQEMSPEARESMGLNEQNEEAFVEAQAKAVASPWFRSFLLYDPQPVLRKVKIPVLALNGSKDLQVDAGQNLPVIERALLEADNKDVTIHVFTGLNHLFQTATTGSVAEYGRIEETFAPVALEFISAWIRSRVD